MNNLYKELVQIIRNATPSDLTPVDTLISVIPMSKEAAYRRLRGEINFTLDEAVKITKEFDVSLDNLIDFSPKSRYSVPMICMGQDEFPDLYKHSFEEIIAILKKLKSCSNPAIYIFTNILLPLNHTFKYNAISKFRMFRRSFRWNEDVIPAKMNETIISPEFLQVENELFRELMTVPTNYVCTSELMQAFVRDIKLYRKMNLITEEEEKNLKNETIGLLDNLERDATKGVIQNNIPFYMFLSESNFDATYLYFSSDEYEVVATQLFGAGFFFFKDIRIINQMKNWKNTLIKNSTLISICGEKQRFDFFRTQRMVVDTL